MDTDTPAGIAELKVDGAFYGGWTKVRVTRSIEQLAGTIELEVTERWPGQPKASPLRPGQACQMLLDGEPVVTGYIDTVAPEYDADSHTIRVTGRDKTADLVDCSAIHKTGQWQAARLDQLARDLVKPFAGLKVVVEADVGAAFSPSYNINEGETVFECLDRAARQRAVLLTSNANGDLVITRAGDKKLAVRLEEGVNIKGARGEFSWAERFSAYTIKAQAKPSDEFNGEPAAQVSASAKDDVISRYRPLVVLAEEHGDGVSASQRATWERNVRMGRGNRGTITVQGWRQPGGSLWQPNALVRVRSPLLWLDADMLIVGCTWTLDERGTQTELSIARREAFDLVAGIGRSRLSQKLNDKAQREKKKKGDDWSGL